MYDVEKKRASINIAFAKYAAWKKSLEFSKKKTRIKLLCDMLQCTE